MAFSKPWFISRQQASFEKLFFYFLCLEKQLTLPFPLSEAFCKSKLTAKIEPRKKSFHRLIDSIVHFAVNISHPLSLRPVQCIEAWNVTISLLLKACKNEIVYRNQTFKNCAMLEIRSFLSNLMNFGFVLSIKTRKELICVIVCCMLTSKDCRFFEDMVRIWFRRTAM